MKTQRETAIIIVRRKKKGHAGHHGGAWKVAFADFMTAMMALFLVLWLVTQSSDVRTAIAGYFQDPLGRADEFGSSIIAGQGAQAAHVRPLSQRDLVSVRADRLAQLSQEIGDALEEGLADKRLASHLLIETVPEGLRISLLEDSTAVFFASGSPVPLPATVDLLTALGRELALVDYPVVVDGHTDATPFAGGGAYSNWELSADRANAARRLIVAGGFPDPRVAEVRGLADREPRMADKFAPQNRRVTLLLKVPEIAAAAPVDSARPTPPVPVATP